MKKLYSSCMANCGLAAVRLHDKASGFVRSERGDLISSLGWMAIMALALVLVKGIVDGGLTSYVNNIFTYLNRVFGSGL